ncbi:MAG: phosphoribosyltransferase family protein [Spirochaetes bacterium]|nr:phosphoribosyltransferase family protein [Spirochaetota bacterium]
MILPVSNYTSVINVPMEGVCDSSEDDSSLSNQFALLQDPKLHSVLITEQCIYKRVTALADDIVADFNHSKHIDILLVLTGSFIFAADLSRAIFRQGGINASIHCIKTSVYDKTIKSSGEHYRAVTLELSPKNIEGRDLLLVEDIADQGFTLSWLKNYLLNERNAKSLKICSLLYKRLDNPTREVQNIRSQLEIDYIGFTVPDVWVAGYGIDAAYEYRHLPFIVRVNEEYFV